MSTQNPGRSAGTLFSVPVVIHATAYIRAKSPEEARHKLFEDIRRDPVLAVAGDEWISDCRFDDPDLPDVSLSPAMTISNGVISLKKFEEVDP